MTGFSVFRAGRLMLAPAALPFLFAVLVSSCYNPGFFPDAPTSVRFEQSRVSLEMLGGGYVSMRDVTARLRPAGWSDAEFEWYTTDIDVVGFIDANGARLSQAVYPTTLDPPLDPLVLPLVANSPGTAFVRIRVTYNYHTVEDVLHVTVTPAAEP